MTVRAFDDQDLAFDAGMSDAKDGKDPDPHFVSRNGKRMEAYNQLIRDSYHSGYYFEKSKDKR